MSSGTPQTFSGGSVQALAYLQQKYGSSIYSQQQEKRYRYWSAVQYPAAGANVINFFGTSQAQSTAQQTNAPQPSNLGNVSFLVQALYLDFYYLGNENDIENGGAFMPSAYTTDTSSAYSDIMFGFVQAGSFSLKIGQVIFAQYPRPFLYAPGGGGKIRGSASGFLAPQSGTTPFAVTYTQSPCYASVARRHTRVIRWQNPVLIEPQQNFLAKISYDSGAIPIRATGFNLNPYVQCTMDGTVFVPVQ
jgi:hypothetical protein